MWIQEILFCIVLTRKQHQQTLRIGEETNLLDILKNVHYALKIELNLNHAKIAEWQRSQKWLMDDGVCKFFAKVGAPLKLRQKAGFLQRRALC